jgi:hypothetical protein
MSGDERVAGARATGTAPSQKRKTGYQKRYKKAFNQIAPKYKLKNGKWKKDGFRAAVKAAHKAAGGEK